MNTCNTCEHFIPDELEDGTGYCALLSDFDPVEETSISSGAEGQFFCHEDFGCALHSANDETVSPEEVAPEQEEPTTPQPPTRASDYLRD